jgi:UDP-N-acetylmuramate--alanine ligase
MLVTIIPTLLWLASSGSLVNTKSMHIYFSGIGGAGIGPLAQVAHEAGYTVSGSDKRDSQYINYLRKHGITDIHIGQTADAIAKAHDKQPIDWLVYTSALPLENPNAPELAFCKEQAIKTSKRDELVNYILGDKNLSMIAIAGTHGKTTTTAMVTWLFKELGEKASYLLPAKTGFAEMGEYVPGSKYFIYEADEFDRNFLAFEPAISLITGVSWDHHEIFPTREDYQSAFREFIEQSGHTYIWQEDADYLGLAEGNNVSVLDSGAGDIESIKLLGRYNRLDAMLAVESVHKATKHPKKDLLDIVSRFPGLSRRMEKLAPNLYSDYAHTPEKIRGAMSVASEMAAEAGKNLAVIYEPLTNRRQHYMLDSYKDVFVGADALYWIPSYLAREEPGQRIIPPAELISHLDEPTQGIAKPLDRDIELKKVIQKHLDNGDMVVGMAGGGSTSLDDWLREEFVS